MPEHPPTLIHHIESRAAERTACNILINEEPPGWPTVTQEPGKVTCFSCRQSRAFKHAQRQHSIVDDFMGVGGPTPVKLSGVMAESPEMRELARRAGRLGYTPPNLNADGDGVFTFHGTHSDLGGEMEVVPMTTGNVEFTVGGSIFNLAHRDRMDLVRALLHGFHYSPEVGGPQPEDN